LVLELVLENKKPPSGGFLLLHSLLIGAIKNRPETFLGGAQYMGTDLIYLREVSV
jgi:hypothetical protein